MLGLQLNHVTKRVTFRKRNLGMAHVLSISNIIVQYDDFARLDKKKNFWYSDD